MDKLSDTWRSRRRNESLKTTPIDPPDPKRSKASRRVKRRSQKLERRLADEIGGKIQPASGALWGAEDDVRRMFEERYEHKYSDSGKYRFKYSDFRLLKSRADKMGEIPIFLIEFPPQKIRMAVIPEGYLEGLGVQGIRGVIKTHKKSHLFTAEDVIGGGRSAITRIEFDGGTVEALRYDWLLEALRG